MNSIERLHIMWDRRWLIIVASVLVAAAAFAWSSSRSKVYEADAVVDVLLDASGEELPTERDRIQIVAGRFAARAQTSDVLREAIRDSGLGISLETARDRVSASPWRGVGFVTIRATGPSPSAATALARGTVRAILRGPGNGVVVSPAWALPDPIAPRPLRDGTLAFLVALPVFAVGAAVLRTGRRRLRANRIRAEVARLTDAAVLAQIPRKGRDPVIEAFRELRAQIEFARSARDVRSVVVTAVGGGAGASYVARGLAQVTANLKASVLLVDANLRTPSVATELHLPAAPGLGDILLGGAFDPTLLPQANPLQKRFRVLTAGLGVPDAPGLLGAGALTKLLDQADAEFVVVDAPPTIEVVDALVVAAQVDASILVVDARRATREDLEEAVTRLRPHSRFLGTVINRARPSRRSRS